MEWLAPAESGAEAYSSYEWYIDEPNSPVWSTDGSTDGEADGLPPPSALAPQVQSFHEKPQLQSQPWTLTHGGGSRDKYDHIDWGRTWAIDACRSTAEPVVRAGPVASAVPAPAFHPSAFFVPRYQVEVAGPRRGPAQVKTEDYTTPGATSGGPALHHGILSAAPPSQPSLTGGATDASFEPETRASESVPAARASSALMSTKKRSHHAAWSRSSQLSGAVNKHPKINAETSSFQALVQAATKRFSRVRASNSKYSSDAYDVSTSATDDSIDGDTKPPMIRPFPPLSRATLSLSKLDLSIAKIVLSGEGRILSPSAANRICCCCRCCRRTVALSSNESSYYEIYRVVLTFSPAVQTWKRRPSSLLLGATPGSTPPPLAAERAR